MNLKTCLAILNVIVWVVVFGCSNTTEIQTPEKIGEKDRINLIIGAKASAVVNKLHGSTVATGGDVIAEYGREKKDLLYITYYTDVEKAKKSFNLMIEKMRATKGGPFTHLMPINKYNGNAYMVIGMGSLHYIIWSGNYLLWLQTDQPFGTALPPRLLTLYPV
ncbi:MAG: hypothetical protein QNK40_01905 [Desulfobacterales bacterium]|nr:hypothetical protein [Desulfobacterales bacterium]